MKRWLQYLRFILYKRGYKLPTTLLDKLKFIRKHVEYINLYDRYYTTIEQDFLEKDVVKYIEELDKILISSLDSKIVQLRVISPASYVKLSYSYWYTFNGIILNDNKLFITWLDKAITFVDWCDVAKTDYSNNYRLNNFRKLSPYYNNILNITEDIFTSILKK